MAGLGTFETSTDVRSTVAFRGNADLTTGQSPIYDGVDAPRRHRCAKVEVLSTT